MHLKICSLNFELYFENFQFIDLDFIEILMVLIIDFH